MYPTEENPICFVIGESCEVMMFDVGSDPYPPGGLDEIIINRAHIGIYPIKEGDERFENSIDSILNDLLVFLDNKTNTRDWTEAELSLNRNLFWIEECDCESCFGQGIPLILRFFESQGIKFHYKDGSCVDIDAMERS